MLLLAMTSEQLPVKKKRERLRLRWRARRKEPPGFKSGARRAGGVQPSACFVFCFFAADEGFTPIPPAKDVGLRGLGGQHGEGKRNQWA